MSTKDLRSIKRWIKYVVKHQYTSDDHINLSKLMLPYRTIGQGKHRIVFDLENGCVLKVAITLFGIKNNKMEKTIYVKAPSFIKVHLAKVMEYGSGWIIMKKYRLSLLKTKKNKNKAMILKREFINEGFIPHDILTKKKTVHWSNLRLNKKNKIVVIDYGNFEIIHRY